MKHQMVNEEELGKTIPRWTAAPIGGTVAPFSPEFIRLPKPKTLCPYTGLSRSKLNELILPSPSNGFRPPVKSISLRKRGQIKAVRLIVYDSLRVYLNQLLMEQTKEVA